jgi:prepilin-type processing-associated H-X9-DG protein/prepilin-type N-terminal cleavage/methylation domain-containing protein
MSDRRQCSFRNAPCSPAFTLIELLVCISVIALLVAIILPTFAKARQQSRGTVCGTNLHQLGIAATMYLNENNDSFWSYYWSAPTGVNWWFGFELNGPNTGQVNRPLDRNRSILAEYIENVHETFLCPSFPYDRGCYFPKFAARSTSYGYNIHLAPIGSAPARRRDRIPRPGEVFAFADGAHFDFNQYQLNEPAYIQYNANIKMASGYAHFRHNDLANVVYVDGHVENQPLRGPAYKLNCHGQAGNLTDRAGGHSIYCVTLPSAS